MSDMSLATNPELDEFIGTVVPSGRMAMPDEVADFIAFLCSPALSYITGQEIFIDNGVTLSVQLR